LWLPIWRCAVKTRHKGSKAHAAMNTLGHLLARHVTAADEQDHAQVGTLAEAVQQITGEHVELAYVDQATQVKMPPWPPRSMAFGWKWSSIPRSSAALRCCHGDGSLNETSPRRLASAAWPESTNDSLQHWPVCTIWFSQSSCSPILPDLSPKANNRL